MNLGQFLIDKSPLASGTVAEHLAAIFAQTGSGPGETVFASKFFIATDEERFEVTSRSARKVLGQLSDRRKPASNTSAGSKAAYPFHSQDSTTVLLKADQLVVSQKSAGTLATQVLDQITINRKRGQK